MFGSNYFGQPYFGQGYAKSGTIFFKVMSAASATVASITSHLQIHGLLLVAASVTKATISKTVLKSLKSSSTTVAAIVTLSFFGLKRLVNATTKALNGIRQSKALSGFNRTTKRVI